LAFRQATYIGPVFHPPPVPNPSKHQPFHHAQHQQPPPPRERQSQTHGDGESSAPLERRPVRRTNPASGRTALANSDTARPSSYQEDYHLVSHARPRILLIRSNTDPSSQQVGITDRRTYAGPLEYLI